MEANKPTAKPDDTAALIRDRLKQMQLRLLDALDTVVDRMMPPAVPAPPPAIARRQLANTLKLWNFCTVNRCRRSQCCRGEPLDCLHIAMPLLTAEHVAAILPKPGRPNRSRHRAAACAAAQS